MKNILLSLTVCLFLQQNSFAGIVADTSILTPAGDEPIQDLIEGDNVTTKAGTQPVTFSSGNKVTDSNLFLINYGESSNLIVTADQIFKMADGSMRRASALVPGKDNLLDEDGKKVLVTSVKVIHFTGDVNAIATEGMHPELGANPDKHTILANGVWVGDYIMQVYCAQQANRNECGVQYSQPTIGH